MSNYHLMKVMREISAGRTRVAKFLLVLACCLCLALTEASDAQSGRQKEGAQTSTEGGTSVDEGEVVRIRTEEILVPVSVRDEAGMPVGGLSAERFLVYDNGERQEISSFNRQRVPANIILLLDASG